MGDSALDLIDDEFGEPLQSANSPAVLSSVPNVAAITGVGKDTVDVTLKSGQRHKVHRPTFNNMTGGALDAALKKPIAPAANGGGDQTQSGLELDSEPQTPGAFNPQQPSQVAPQGTAAPVQSKSDPSQFTSFAPPPQQPQAPAVPTLESQSASTQSTSGVNIATQQAQMQQGAAQQKQGVQEQADAQARALSAQAFLDRKTAERDQSMIAQRAEIAERSTKEQQRMFGEIQSIQSDLADKKIDPNHFWSSKTDGQKFGLSLGVALMSLGNGLMRTPDDSMEFINRQIDRDINVQRENMQNSRRGLEDKINALGVARTISHDELEQKDIARTLMLEAAKSKALSLAESSQSDVVRANAKVVAGRIDQEIGQTSANLANAAAARTTTAVTSASRVGGRGTGLDANGNPVAAAISTAAMQRSTPGLHFADTAAADEWLNKNRAVAKEVYDKIGGVSKVVDATNAYQALRAKHNGYISETKDPDDYQMALQLRQTIISGGKSSNGEGSDKETNEKWEKLVPSPDDHAFRTVVGGKDPVQQRLEAIKRDAVLSGNGALKALPGASYDPMANDQRFSAR